MSRLSTANTTATVLLTALMALFFPLSGVGAAQGYEFSSLTTGANPNQADNPETQRQLLAANVGASSEA